MSAAIRPLARWVLPPPAGHDRGGGKSGPRTPDRVVRSRFAGRWPDLV